ncbi:MAG: TraM recognition domain-containing protein [Microlunatus sp.]|nr:TraM recognition domain-containing protein [Microlunatus sp.]
MTTTSNRRPDPGGMGTEAILLLIGVLIVVIGGGTLYAAVRLGHQIDGSAEGLPSDPYELIFGLFSGKVSWPAAGAWILAAAAVLVLALVLLFVLAWRKGRKKASRVDRAASVMGSGRDIEPLSRRNAAAAATRWSISAAAVGVPLGCTVRDGQPLVSSWEDMLLLIAGPRTMKTTSFAVPAILEAPGAVMVTSNKRDVADATREVRAERGPVWVFDPQQIVGEEPTWWWNPLSYVTDETKAANLAEHFAAGSREQGARTDPHFEENGQDLLAGALLAAALDGRPITDVYTWLTRPSDTTPAEIVRQHGYALIADQFEGMVLAPDKERGSIFSTARRMASCLTFGSVHPWVTPRNGGYDSRPQFDPAEFVRSGGTLYSLSKEGKGTSGPLVTALTVAVVEAGEELAKQSAFGRLSVPMLGVLDEAANVCRWRELPNLYSHYGSRGIVLMTILQSWSQGVDVWGESGMNKLFSAANVFIYGGGVREERFLESLSKIIGDYDRVASSTSTGHGHRTVSRQLVRHRILDVDELAALPKGRAIVLASGARPTLIRTQPWMTGPHAEAVKASIAVHDPQASRTLDEVQTELAQVATADRSRGADAL